MLPRRTCLLSIVLLLAGAASAGAAEPVRVRVLTYNIHHGEGTDGQLDLPRIAGVIKRLEPDLVALQEVDVGTRRAQGVDQATELGRLTGMHAVFGKAMDYGGGQYGEALLSRWPLTDVRVHDLPFTPGREPRCAVAARVSLGGDGPAVVLAGTHLEHADAALRLCQAGKLAPSLAAGNSLPTILAGDFNAEPASPPIQVLLPHWTDASAGKPEATYPADRPTVRIDYVFFRSAERWRVVQTQVVDERIASDHRPLLVVLEWVPAP